MDLKIKDIAELLDVPESTIREWVEKKKIPFYRVKNQDYFNKSEINEWILKNNIKVSNKIFGLRITTKPLVITGLIEQGGIHYGIRGKTVAAVIKNAVARIPVPSDISKKTILSLLMERESMMTTAVGHGIAFPHPRNPITSAIENESISICLLDKPVDFKALDGRPVHSLFIIISSSPKRHLEILSKISYLCQQDIMVKMLEYKSNRESILRFVQQVETEWGEK